MALESGKPLREARGEVARCALVLEEAAEEARRIAGHVVPVDAVEGSEDRIALTISVPVGVIAAITPFNFPLYRRAQGRSRHRGGQRSRAQARYRTPLTALMIAGELLEQAASPRGACNDLGPGGAIGDLLVPIRAWP